MLRIEGVVSELERLERGPALTVYLRTDAFGGAAADPRGELHTVLELLRRSLGAGTGETHAPAFEIEAEALAERMGAVPLGSRGVALFSCSRRLLFHAVPLDLPLHSAAYWGDRFELAPLRSALDRAERVLVLLVDERQARLIRVMWGELEEAQPLLAAPPAPANGLPAGAPLSLQAHVGRVAEAVRHLTQSKRVDRILAGGDAGAMTLLRELMPGELTQRLEVCPELPADASAERVLQCALELLWRTHRERDDRLVEELLQAAARGQAAVGPGAVAEALASGDVGRLVVPEGLHLLGGECSACGLLAPVLTPVCLACGAPLRLVGDLVERMEERVAGAGGEVEEVGGQAAAVLAEHQGMGAFLRGSALATAGR